jgi:hypothetical protein
MALRVRRQVCKHLSPFAAASVQFSSEAAPAVEDAAPKYKRHHPKPMHERTPFMARCVKDIRQLAKEQKFDRALALAHQAASRPNLSAEEQTEIFSVTAPLLARGKQPLTQYSLIIINDDSLVLDVHV